MRRRSRRSRRRSKFARRVRFALALSGIAALAALFPGCTTPPRNPDNLCSVFAQRHAWYRATRSAEKRWAIDQATQMAVIFQESSFRANARPARRRLFGVIPWTRPSSAYGYSQAVDTTWNVYRREVSRPRAERDRFPDAADFIGWYLHRVATRAKIDKHNAESLYLAYHEGAGGFTRGSHRNKGWLVEASQRVGRRAARYRAQLAGCREKLESERWWWPF